MITRPARYLVLAAAVICLAALTECRPKDSPLRLYIRDQLEPYLDSLAYQLCEVKYLAAPDVPGRIVCPGPPEGYKKPPGNGAP
jgi:hypothetical protein